VQCPLTLDHDALLELLDGLDFGLAEDGTAIGMGLATSVAGLRSSRTPSKVVVLLTDGNNNRGSIDPLTGADLARAFGVKVYTGARRPRWRRARAGRRPRARPAHADGADGRRRGHPARDRAPHGRTVLPRDRIRRR
jgi:hypothetical protein